ncbi:hypothetical protein [Citrobacter werkmanii]|uniref:hypothetical protein n=1 Tax=Citrobacter werkmanii TaxID=67827 RepID=UPI00300D7E31
MNPVYPTLSGFIAFVRNVMGVPDTIIADDDPMLEYSYHAGLEWVNTGMGLNRLPTIYTATVYNAGASVLINHAVDTPPSTYWADVRKSMGIGAPIVGVMSSASDQGTSGSTVLGDAMSNLSLVDLMAMRDPYGQQVIAVLMEQGPVWGYTP